jgi:hypothetical protein
MPVQNCNDTSGRWCGNDKFLAPQALANVHARRVSKPRRAGLKSASRLLCRNCDTILWEFATVWQSESGD